jgi:hypothetical protein
MRYIRNFSLYSANSIILTLLSSPCYPHPVILSLLSSPCYPHPVILTLLSSPLSSPCYSHPIILTLLSSPCYPHPIILTLLSSPCYPSVCINRRVTYVLGYFCTELATWHPKKFVVSFLQEKRKTEKETI